MFTQTFLTLIASYSLIVIGITQSIKKLLTVSGTVAFFISFAISFIVTISVFSEGLVYYITLSLFVCLSSNGIFKSIHK